MIGTPEFAGIEHDPEPAGETHGRVDREHQHDNDRDRPQDGSQEEGRHACDDGKHDRDQGLHVIPGGVREGTVQRHVPGQVVGHVRIAVASPVEKMMEMVGDFEHRRIRVLRQGKVDHEPGHRSVVRNQAPGDLGCVQRDIPDPLEIRVRQGIRVIDQRLDSQVVPVGPAVRMIGKRVDAR